MPSSVWKNESYRTLTATIIIISIYHKFITRITDASIRFWGRTIILYIVYEYKENVFIEEKVKIVMLYLYIALVRGMILRVQCVQK